MSYSADSIQSTSILSQISFVRNDRHFQHLSIHCQKFFLRWTVITKNSHGNQKSWKLMQPTKSSIICQSFCWNRLLQSGSPHDQGADEKLSFPLNSKSAMSLSVFVSLSLSISMFASVSVSEIWIGLFVFRENRWTQFEMASCHCQNTTLSRRIIVAIVSWLASARWIVKALKASLTNRQKGIRGTIAETEWESRLWLRTSGVQGKEELSKTAREIDQWMVSEVSMMTLVYHLINGNLAFPFYVDEHNQRHDNDKVRFRDLNSVLRQQIREIRQFMPHSIASRNQHFLIFSVASNTRTIITYLSQ
jgi:hypothetical protein